MTGVGMLGFAANQSLTELHKLELSALSVFKLTLTATLLLAEQVRTSSISLNSRMTKEIKPVPYCR
jgi:hypothetical protein